MLASKQSKKVRGSFPEESDSLAIQSGLIDWREFTGTQGVVKIADAKAHGITSWPRKFVALTMTIPGSTNSGKAYCRTIG
jgi:hypothetical protein